MTVLLEKRLTDRQQWVLEHLSGCGWITTHESTDSGTDFVCAYGREIGVVSFDSAKRSLQRVIRSMQPMGLTEVRTTWQQGGMYRGVGVSRMSEYRATPRGERAAQSHDTYD